MSRKIKITEAQAKMLQELDTPKVIKITEAQFKLIESDLNTIPKSKRPSIKVAKAFKQSGVTEDGEDLLGHPVAGSGGKEYNPQTVTQNKKTTKSFNEGDISEGFADILDYQELVKPTWELIKHFLSNKSQAGLDPFWVKLGFTHGELNKILTTAGVLVTGVFAGEKGFRVLKKKYKAWQQVKRGAAEIFDKYEEKKRNTMKKRVPTVHGDNTPKDPNDPRYSKVVEAPMGANQDPRNPEFQKDALRTNPRTPNDGFFEELYTNKELSILRDRDGKKYLFTYSHIEPEEFIDYSDTQYTTSQGDDDEVDIEYDMDTLDIDGEVIERYVNDNIKYIPMGKGLDGYNDGKDINLINSNEFANYILKLDRNAAKVLGIQETTTAGGSSGAFVAPLGTDVIRGKLKEASVPKISMFSDESGVEMKTMDDVKENEINESDDLVNSANQLATYLSNLDRTLNSEDVYQMLIKNPNILNQIPTDDNFLALLSKLNDVIIANKDNEGLQNSLKVFKSVIGVVDEETTTGSVGGSYVGPMMWAKDKDSHKPAKKTMYPKGKFVAESTSNDFGKYRELFSELNDNIQKAKADGKNVGLVSAGGSKYYFHLEGVEISDTLISTKVHISGKKDTLTNDTNRGKDISANNLGMANSLLKQYYAILKDAKYGDITDLSNINEPKTIQVTESNLSDVAYPDGKFVEFDDCTKLNNNKDAQNGGCSTGAVDGVAKEKGSKNSVISKEALYYEIAKKTGKSEKEVETIIEGYLLNKEK
mgnify:FL=1|jgi:hypothetical protein|tara:strand:+ start:27066 stop:29348 length:2283 start_codon:yes stop_codon:yes gene_type:complete